jgi:fructose-1,6-bisphosphatase/inositol monophosphatase family enzyme
MLYHPIANLLIETLEQKINRYTKDFYEISFIQSGTGAPERFASISVSTFAKSIKQALFKKFNGVLYTSTLLNTLEEEKFGERNLILLFNPIDCHTNFSRGIPSFGVSFLLQEITPKGVIDVFSIVYSFQTQDTIYSDAFGSYIKGRPLKPVLRKTPKLCLIACNTNALCNGLLLEKFKQVQVSNSIVNDINLIAKGKIDAVRFDGLPLAQMLPLNLLAKSLRINEDGKGIHEISKELSSQTMDIMLANKSLLEELNKVAN